MRKPVLVLAALALFGSAFAYSSSAYAFPKHKCGSFVPASDDGTTSGSRIRVYNSEDLACSVAMKVIKAFFDPNVQKVSHGGPSQVEIYYTMKGLPGWRCYTGAGGGGCIRQGKTAAYLTALL